MFIDSPRAPAILTATFISFSSSAFPTVVDSVIIFQIMATVGAVSSGDGTFDVGFLEARHVCLS